MLRKVFKGGKYSRVETIWGNTVPKAVKVPTYLHIKWTISWTIFFWFFGQVAEMTGDILWDHLGFIQDLSERRQRATFLVEAFPQFWKLTHFSCGFFFNNLFFSNKRETEVWANSANYIWYLIYPNIFTMFFSYLLVFF